MNTITKLPILVLLLSVVMVQACSEKEFDPADPGKSYIIAKEPYDDSDWERAIVRLGEFRARFPYSQYAIEAELLIANAQFELEHYAEAVAGYEQFAKLHPRHPQLDYAMFRTGESYWADAPDAPDREQEYTKKAVEAWQDLVARIPQGKLSKKARKLIKEGRERIASSDDFISAFYCKMEIYHACAYRSIKMVRDFEEFKDLRKNGFSRAALSLRKVADAKSADPKSDANLFIRDYTEQQLRGFADQLERGEIPDGLAILKKQ